MNESPAHMEQRDPTRLRATGDYPIEQSATRVSITEMMPKRTPGKLTRHLAGHGPPNAALKEHAIMVLTSPPIPVRFSVGRIDLAPDLA